MTIFKKEFSLFPYQNDYVTNITRNPITILVLFLFCFALTISAAEERSILIKVAQYPTAIEFNCPQGSGWNMGGQTGSIQSQDKCQLAGVLLKPAVKRYHVMVASVALAETARLNESLEEWKAAGFPVKTIVLGEVLYDSDNRTILLDNRKGNVEVGVFDNPRDAQALVDKLASQGKSSWIFVEIVSRSVGTLKLIVNGQTTAEGPDLMLVPGQTILLRKVEYGAGYPWHGFADRTYRGTMVVQWGAQDAIDCILKTGMESVLAGVVPSEISSKAEIGALQAQAVAARGEILGKIGARHPGEGFDTCSEQHCQVYSGESAESVTVAQKIAPTRGTILVSSGGSIVDAVYAANCGGHGEACHLVWSTPPNPILAGVWDSASPPSLDLSEEEQVGVFIRNPPDCYCKDPTVEGGVNFRWKKTFAPADWKIIENGIGIGRIKKVTDIARGFSGRIYRITFTGEKGTKTIMKELNIRRLLGGLKSACFVAAWTFDSSGFITGGELAGAGFGHGVGMCQTGAQSLAKRGWAFDRILSHYFTGSILKKLY